jgi:hypothetical protein
MKQEKQRFVVKFFRLKGRGSKNHQELIATLGDDASGLSQIKTWLPRFKTEDFSCSDLLRAGRPPITLGPQVVVFL